MKNRILAITRNTIPYCKELHRITGGVLATLLMQQMDYWFDKKPNGFYKFLSPCKHNLYVQGDSWCEELGFTDNEFRTAFDAIGIRYMSKSAFDKTDDKFKGKFFYASYVDRRSNMTLYFRNHDLVDSSLDELINRLTYKQSGEEIIIGKTQVIDCRSHPESGPPVKLSQAIDFNTHLESGFPVNSQSAGQEIHFPQHPYTETTAEPTISKTTTTTEGSSVHNKISNTPTPSLIPDSLVYPAIDTEEIEEIKKILIFCPARFMQLILDETEGQRVLGFKKTAISFARAMVQAAQQGTFRPNLAIRVARERKIRIKDVTSTFSSPMPIPTEALLGISEKIYRQLPPTIRKKHDEAMARLLKMSQD